MNESVPMLVYVQLGVCLIGLAILFYYFFKINEEEKRKK